MSYKNLLNAWKKERDSQEIQDIPAGFIIDMQGYLQTLNATQSDPETLVGSILQKEKTYAAQLLNELVENRLQKILLNELNGRPIDANVLTPEEQKLHLNLRQLITEYKRSVELSKIEQPSPPQKLQEIEPFAPREVIKLPSLKEVEMVVVRFLQPLPAIIGIDLKAYGPFKKEDIANIPRENALNLIRRGIAKRVEIKP
jgi:DNA replication factor GINS